jgi:hypothetical protein
MIRRLGRWIEDNLTPSGPAHPGLAKKMPRRGEGSLQTTQKLTGWDSGKSARRVRNRPQYSQMISELKAGLVDAKFLLVVGKYYNDAWATG